MQVIISIWLLTTRKNKHKRKDPNVSHLRKKASPVLHHRLQWVSLRLPWIMEETKNKRKEEEFHMPRPQSWERVYADASNTSLRWSTTNITSLHPTPPGCPLAEYLQFHTATKNTRDGVPSADRPREKKAVIFVGEVLESARIRFHGHWYATNLQYASIPPNIAAKVVAQAKG